METLIVLIVGWFGASVGLLIALHGRTLASVWREPVLGCPVLVIESDDWGPGSADDAVVLRSLAAMLGAVRDGVGHPAVMTLGVVSGIPNGAAILASGTTRYVRRTLVESDFAPIVDAMLAGCRSGVFTPQWHGLEHCWPASLLARARDDIGLRRWLADPDARSEDLPSALQSRWVDTSRLPSRALERNEVEAAVAEEAVVLRQVFGYLPGVAVPNTFVWNDDVERAWSAAGVSCIVTPGRRFEGRDEAGALLPPTRTFYNGERTAAGVLVVVRDEYFEPARGHRAEQVWEAVARKTALGRPTLLETHRQSFIAAPDVADAAMHELERALRGVQVRYPGVRFLSTAELAAHLGDPASPLCEQALARRAGAFLARLDADAALARFVKYSGLKIPLRLSVAMLHTVTHGRFASSCE